MPDEQKLICTTCVGEPYLRKAMLDRGKEIQCSYCHREGTAISISEIADSVESALDHHFYKTATEPKTMEYLLFKETGDWERSGDPINDVIEDITQIDPQPAEDIREELARRSVASSRDEMGEEGPFDNTAQYASKPVSDSEFWNIWASFREQLQKEARYFNRSAEKALESIFEGLHEHNSLYGNRFVLDAGPGSKLPSLYRARVFQSEAKLEEALKRPDLEIGPPPMLAAHAGRMNAHGISVFYGATDPLVAIGEVRPPVGSTVILGQFDIIRPVRLLDIEALRSVKIEGSVFDPDYLNRLKRAEFLNGLSHHIAEAVMPDDEPFDYLVTQAIADFLASQTQTPLDGIIYPSVQCGGEGTPNVVLFHKASRVQPMDIPEGTTMYPSTYSWTDDGPVPDYAVFEEAPPISDSPGQDATVSHALIEDDERIPTLKLNLESLRVHSVAKAVFTTMEYAVRRKRSTKAAVKS